MSIGHDTYILEQAMDALESALALPRVASDGSSECPFAENMFAQKEEKEAALVGRLPDMRRWLQNAQSSVRNARQNLNGKWVDPSRYDDAVNARLYYDIRDTDSYEECRYLQALFDHRRLQDALNRADELLRRSGETRWPLGRPQRAYGSF